MTIYIDMDGVLAKWNTSATVADTHKPGYFLKREEEPGIKNLIQYLTAKGYEVRILTAAYEDGTAKADKQKWLKEHSIDVPVTFVPYGKNKAAYVDENGVNFLIDDYSRNLREWEESGNTGIKFYNGVNGNFGTWHGHSISHLMDAEKLCTIIENIIAK